MKQQEPSELLSSDGSFGFIRFMLVYIVHNACAWGAVGPPWLESTAYTRSNLHIKLWKSPCIAGMANPAFISRSPP